LSHPIQSNLWKNLSKSDFWECFRVWFLFRMCHLIN
jgi:hypothetical protein